jgi:hypothetical protein
VRGPWISNLPQVDKFALDIHTAAADPAEAPAAPDGAAVPEVSRLETLKADNDALRQQVADLKAALKAATARQPESTSPPESTGPPGHDADRPGATKDSGTENSAIDKYVYNDVARGIDAERGGVEKDTPQQRAVTVASIGIFQTLVGAVDTVAQFSMHATPDGAVGLGIMALGLIQLGLGKIDQRREGKNDRQNA